jgi:hypothetical protein
VFETGESELNPGGLAYVGGAKPLLDSSNWTMQIGKRADQATAVSWSSAVSPNSRTGKADFREDGRYHRARVTVTGTFNAAQGVQFDAIPSGEV